MSGFGNNGCQFLDTTRMEQGSGFVETVLERHNKTSWPFGAVELHHIIEM